LHRARWPTDPFARIACFIGQENIPPSRVGALAQPAVAASTAPEASQAVDSSRIEMEGEEGWVPLEGPAGLRAMAPDRPVEAGGVPTPHVSLHLVFDCNRCNQISSQISS
jgi:hypothetical protein